MSRVLPRRTSQGTTRLLRIIVESAIDSTITMPVAAEIPPTNDEQGQPLLVLDQGQRQHEVVGSGHGRVGKDQHAPEGDRQHEEIDEQQVHGEHPHRGLDVATRACCR